MKIKQVCDRTGLTERTVRYYIERGIISPTMTEQNDRTYYDFSEKDIETLETVTVLKNAQFSLEEIILFLKEPSAIRKTVTAHIDKLETHSEKERETLDKLSQYRGTYFASAKELADTIKNASAVRHRHEMKLDFGKGDDVREEEREQALQNMKDRIDRQYLVGRRLVIAMIASEMVRWVISIVFIRLFQLGFVNIISLFLDIYLSWALYKGRRWAKWLWMIFHGLYAVLNVASVGFVLTSADFEAAVILGAGELFFTIIIVSFVVLSVAISACSAILLLKSESVNTFLREQDM